MDERELVIVGGGPAGMAAAVSARWRENLSGRKLNDSSKSIREDRNR